MFFASLLESGVSRRRGGRLRAALLIGAAFAFPTLGTACGNIDPFTNQDPPPGNEPSVAFADSGTLELLPAEVRTVDVITDPNAKVQLLLLGDAFDASLDAGEIVADESGRAHFELRAPTQPAAFVLRAKVGESASAELDVSVSEFGFASVRVVPKYAGKRDLGGWTADILVGQTCDVALALDPEEPMALHDEAAEGEQPIIESVPVGPQLAVAVRSGALAAGCVTFTASKPDATEEVEVTVFDKPMVLDGVTLDVSLDFTPTGEGYAPLLEASIADLAEAAYPSQTPFTTLLLDAMAAELDTTPAESLGYLRSETSLDESVANVLQGYHAYNTCIGLKSSAIDYALTDAQSNTSRIEGRVSTLPDELTPSFELASFSGLSPADVGAPEVVPFSWNATADDVLVISGVLPVSNTRLAGAFMKSALSAQSGEPTPVPDAIASLADCGQIATVIATSGVEGCNADCLEDACIGAIQTLWDAGLAAGDSSDGSIGSLQISVAGNAKVDSTLTPSSFLGSWLGTLSHAAQGLGSELESSVAGEATGEVPPPP